MDESVCEVACEACIACWDDLTEQNKTMFSLLNTENVKIECSYCWDCAIVEINEHFLRWKKSVDEADCAAALKRLIEKGPPITFADVDITKLINFVGQFDCVIQNNNGEKQSACLIGAPPTIQERDELWSQMKNIVVIEKVK